MHKLMPDITANMNKNANTSTMTTVFHYMNQTQLTHLTSIKQAAICNFEIVK